jgi:hypothetical protein
VSFQSSWRGDSIADLGLSIPDSSDGGIDLVSLQLHCRSSRLPTQFTPNPGPLCFPIVACTGVITGGGVHKLQASQPSTGPEAESDVESIYGRPGPIKSAGHCEWRENLDTDTRSLSSVSSFTVAATTTLFVGAFTSIMISSGLILSLAPDQATFSRECYPRTTLPGCKGPLYRFEKASLRELYIAVFCTVFVHLGAIAASILCSNHVNVTFGKGLTPRLYRLDVGHVRRNAVNIIRMLSARASGSSDVHHLLHVDKVEPENEKDELKRASF